MCDRVRGEINRQPIIVFAGKEPPELAPKL